MMAKSNRSNRNKPIAAAATAVGAAAAGLFLWSKRTQISEQLSDLSDRFNQWTESMRANSNTFEAASDTAPSGERSASASGTRRPAARRKTAPSEAVTIDETPAA